MYIHLILFKGVSVNFHHHTEKVISKRLSLGIIIGTVTISDSQLYIYCTELLHSNNSNNPYRSQLVGMSSVHSTGCAVLGRKPIGLRHLIKGWYIQQYSTVDHNYQANLATTILHHMPMSRMTHCLCWCRSREGECSLPCALGKPPLELLLLNFSTRAYS